MIIIDLIYKLSLLVALTVISGLLIKKYHKNSLSGQIVQGILFATVAVLGISDPFIYKDGIIFDGRSIVISLSSFFFGPITGLIVSIASVVTRMIIGGGGATAGFLVILSSYLIGCLFFYYNLKKKKEKTIIDLFNIGFAVHVLMFIIIGFIPSLVFTDYFKTLSITILIIYPLTTVLTGVILKNNEDKINLINELNIEQKRFSQALTSSDIWVWEINLDGLYTYASENVKNILGYTSNEIINKLHFYDLFDLSINEKVKKVAFELINEGKPFINFENKNITKSGNVIYLETSGIPLYDKKGKVIGFRGADKDITSRKLFEKELRKSEFFFRLVWDKSASAMRITDKNGYILKVNDAYCKLVEKSRNNLEGHLFSVIYPEFDKDRIINKHSNRFNERETYFQSEKKINLWNGKTKWINVSNTYLDLSENQTLLLGIFNEITERKLNEEKLIEAETKLRDIIENSVNLFYSHTIDNVLTYVSPQVKKLLGYEIEEAKVHWNNFLTDNPINQIGIEFTIKAIETGIPQPIYEIELKRKDGTNIWVEVREAPVVKDGKTVSIVGSLTDITEIKIAKFALKESEERFRNLFKNSMTINLLINPENGDIIDANFSAEEFYGWYIEELTKKKIFEISLLPESRVRELYNSALNNQKISFESKHRTASGEVKIVQVYLSKVSIGNNNYIHANFYDITEKKRAEYRVNLLGKVIEQSPVSIIITDAIGNIEFVNNNLLKVTGYTYEEVIGKNPKIFKSEQTDSRTYEEMWDTILSGKVWSGDILNKKKNNNLFWEKVYITAIVNDDGDITHFAAVKEDISEKIKLIENIIDAKQKAESASKLKSEFLAQMSHEIRTPLNTTINSSKFLKSELEGNIDNDLITLFDSIDSAGRRIIRTVDLILNMSEIEIGSYEPKWENVDIILLIKDLLNLDFKNDISNSNLNVNFHYDKESKFIFCDKYSVQQIVIQLVDNALKYTEEGYVDISVESNNSNIVKLKISDTGIGISDEYMKNIFHVFTQEDKGNTRKFDGNGIGLALTKKYCDLNKAEISVSSIKGKGTSIEVIFN